MFRSTKQENKKAAERVVREWEDAARKAKGGVLTQAALVQTIGEMVERVTGETMEVVTTGAFLESWLRSKEKTGKAASTVTRYRPIIEGFRISIGLLADRGMMAITPRHLEKFRDQQIDAGKRPTTVNYSIKILRGIFNDARRKGLIPTNPAEAVDLVDGQGQERKPFSPDQVRALLSKASIEWRGMILLGYHAGLRIGD
ncbi:MAG: phage integrase SAM-like domain-containing protein, partial [Verrucomicrobiota bacterium]